MEHNISQTELISALGIMAAVIGVIWKLLWDQINARFTERDKERADLRERMETCEDERKELFQRVATLEGALQAVNLTLPPNQRFYAKS